MLLETRNRTGQLQGEIWRFFVGHVDLFGGRGHVDLAPAPASTAASWPAAALANGTGVPRLFHEPLVFRRFHSCPGVRTILWLGTAWLCYANWLRTGRRKVIARLEGLRFVLVTLLAFTLLRPEMIWLIKRTEQPAIAVLCDASASMQTRDIAAATNVLSRAEWLQQQRATQLWKPLEKNARVTVEDFAAPAQSTNGVTAKTEEGTDLNHALETVLQHQRNLKAVLLLTDGDWNLGKSPVSAATRFREQNIPIFAVAVGRETPLPDLFLEGVSAPAYGLLGEQISIPFKIQSHLPRSENDHLLV